MTKTYFGFAVADGMFPLEATIKKLPLKAEQVRKMVEIGVEPCLNPSHEATIVAMRDKYGIDVPIPKTPPRVSLNKGDRVVVMGVRGLPRLTDNRHYTSEEIENVTFAFSIYEVL